MDNEQEEKSIEVFDGMGKIDDNTVIMTPEEVLPSAEEISGEVKEQADLPQMTPEELQAYEAEQEKLFFADPENRKNAVLLAEQIREHVSKNWFTFARFVKKSKEDPQIGLYKLNLLHRFDLIKVKTGTAEEGLELRGVKMYKVTIDKQDHINIIDEMILYHKGHIEQLELSKRAYR